MLNDPAALSSAGAWSMNVFSSVGLIMVNKAVMSWYHFVYPTSLTALHFITTAAVGKLSQMASAPKALPSPRDHGTKALHSAAASRSLNAKSIPVFTSLWFSLVASLAVVTMNLSLMLNSVGFYQIAKLSIIPSCCLFEAILHGKTYSRSVTMAVIVVMLGVAICTVTDVSVSGPGLIAAIAAVLSTTFQQIYIGQLQKKYSIGSFDLLSKTAPYQAVLLILSGPPVDYLLSKKNVFYYDITYKSAAIVGASCLLALFVNLSMYLCIGKFSAVSFQVLGHMKTLLVLALGWILFGAAVTMKNVLGMSVAVVGMVIYSWAVEKEKVYKAAVVTLKPMTDDVESQRLLGDEVHKRGKGVGAPAE